MIPLLDKEPQQTMPTCMCVRIIILKEKGDYQLEWWSPWKGFKEGSWVGSGERKEVEKVM